MSVFKLVLIAAAAFIAALLVVVLEREVKKADLNSGCAGESISPRAFATARLVGDPGEMGWNIEIKSINGQDGYYLLKDISPAIDGIDLPHIFHVSNVPQVLSTKTQSDPSISIDSDDSFALLDAARLAMTIDGIYPVVGDSEVIQVAGSSIGRVSHTAELGIENAIDIKADIGADVMAIRSGVVAYVESRYPDSGCDSSEMLRRGNKIIVVDASGVEIVYGHLQQGSSLVNEGDYVKAGQVIARIGNSGKSVVPHLHIHAGGVTRAGYKTIPIRLGCGSDAAEFPKLGGYRCD